ncbi:hypothetical protein [Asaia astilbis]|uniref:hypothetical protein n=1 Tax=Asaia astilbis TaxID=610244 RepID=UPI0004711B30|nr:hypothetical protein [Asaia astilbis]
MPSKFLARILTNAVLSPLAIGLLTGLLNHALAVEAPVIAGTYNTPSIQTYDRNGQPRTQIDAASLTGRRIIAKDAETDMLAVETDKGLVYVTEDSVEANIRAIAPTPTQCVQIGAASADEVGGSTNNLGRNCHGS